jgi:hypothetical protein
LEIESRRQSEVAECFNNPRKSIAEHKYPAGNEAESYEDADDVPIVKAPFHTAPAVNMK